MPRTSRSGWNDWSASTPSSGWCGEQEFPDRTLTLRYRFVHVLYQNALYASLRPTRRASLSAAVAQALLGYYGEKSAAVAAELALLLEAAREFARAADYFLLAAQNAARIFANQEAVVLARRGLELLETLPDTPERARKELALQITLGPALMATKGWTAPEVERTYTRAHELCRAGGRNAGSLPGAVGTVALPYQSRGDPDGAEPGGAASQPGPTRARPGAAPAGSSRAGTDLCERRRLDVCTDPPGAGHRSL